MTDPLSAAQERFEQLTSYRATIHSTPLRGAPTQFHYAYRRPGYVRMDFVTPHHGAVLAYDPAADKVRLRPFGAGVPPVLSLSPTNPLVCDASGHRVDASDIGTLLRNVRALRQHGAMDDTRDDPIDGFTAVRVTVAGAPGHVIAGVHRYVLWLDARNGFPRKVVSYAADDGTPLETVTLDDVELDVAFPERFFDP